MEDTPAESAEPEPQPPGVSPATPRLPVFPHIPLDLWHRLDREKVKGFRTLIIAFSTHACSCVWPGWYATCPTFIFLILWFCGEMASAKFVGVETRVTGGSALDLESCLARRLGCESPSAALGCSECQRRGSVRPAPFVTVRWFGASFSEAVTGGDEKARWRCGGGRFGCWVGSGDWRTATISE